MKITVKPRSFLVMVQFEFSLNRTQGKIPRIRSE